MESFQNCWKNTQRVIDSVRKNEPDRNSTIFTRLLSCNASPHLKTQYYGHLQCKFGRKSLWKDWDTIGSIVTAVDWENLLIVFIRMSTLKMALTNLFKKCWRQFCNISRWINIFFCKIYFSISIDWFAAFVKHYFR